MIYIEDLFITMVDTMEQHRLPMQANDRSAAYSFYSSISKNTALTEKQGAYVLKILTKYRKVCKDYFDYEDRLDPPIWKTPFRTIDQSKKVWVETLENSNLPVLAFKFPFAFKDTFDSEFHQSYSNQSVWDKDRKIRLVHLYSVNIMQVYEFVKLHNFELEQSFLDTIDLVEDIWQNSNSIVPSSFIKDNQVVLKNPTEDAENYWQQNKKGKLSTDLILAKNMGYNFIGETDTKIKKIASDVSNSFWVKNLKEFIELTSQIDGKVCLLLDQTADNQSFIDELPETLDLLGCDRKEWRVCFRLSNKKDPEFNQWISDNGFGGKISTAKYFIFQHKPHKWLFKKENDVIILGTNNLNPSSYTLTRNMLKYHPCVIYIGDVIPTTHRKQKIVAL